MISSRAAQSDYSRGSFTAAAWARLQTAVLRFRAVLRRAATILLYCGLIGGGCQVGDTMFGNDNEPAGSTAHLDSLPMWHAEIELALGQREQPGHDFIAPSPIGTDPNGFHYVIDSSLREVRRFDSVGTYLGTLVRPGEGPGEMRFFPRTFGLSSEFISGQPESESESIRSPFAPIPCDPGTRDSRVEQCDSGLVVAAGDSGFNSAYSKRYFIWYSEEPTGRFQFVSLDGSSTRVEDTGWTPAHAQAFRLSVEPLPRQGEYRVQALSLSQSSDPLRPVYEIRFLHVRAGVAELVHHHSGPGQTIQFDGGRTTMRYPGPPDQPVFFFDDHGRVLRVDRPVPAGGKDPVAEFELIGPAGFPLRRGSVTLPAASLSRPARDSILAAFLNGASWDGARPVDASLRRQLVQYAEAIPDQRPGFDAAAQGPNGTAWLRLSHQTQPGSQRWIVIDSTFAPIAQARVPANVASIVHTDDGSWWATLRGDEGLVYVARLRFVTKVLDI